MKAHCPVHGIVPCSLCDLTPDSAVCRECGGTGGVDSGAVTPWMALIDIPCPSCIHSAECADPDCDGTPETHWKYQHGRSAGWRVEKLEAAIRDALKKLNWMLAPGQTRKEAVEILTAALDEGKVEG